MVDKNSGARARLDALARHPLGRLLARVIGSPEDWADLLQAGRRRSRRALRLEARRLAAAGLVAPRWYRGSRPGLSGPAAEHYLRHGAAAGHDPHPDFDARRYGVLFPEADAAPAAHFLARAEAQDALLPTVLRAEVEPLPPSLHTGLGTALFMRGWAYPTRGRTRFLDLFIGDERHPIVDLGQPRPDVLDAEMAHDPEGNSFFGGFEAVVALPAVTAPSTRALRLRLVTHDGTVLERGLGTLTLLPGTGRAPVPVVWPDKRSGEGPRVAICMATHQPPLDLFAAQVASIKAQTHANWICIVSDDASPDVVVARMAPLLDDPRFVLLRNRDRLDFYGNFERALRAVPADADLVALSDQDDSWHPDKLATLIGALDEGAELAYADVRIVDAEGRAHSDTFWVTRRNNFTSLPSLMAANTIMGAASLFRTALLEQVLPFPDRLGAAYHDHWIGLNALVKGGIRYVDRPLHDYIQHGGNVIGHKRDADAPGLAAAGRAVLSALRHRGPLGHTLRDMTARATQDRQSLVAQKVVLSRVLLMRHPGARPELRRVLTRLAGLTRLAPALRERLLSALEKRPTLNHEGHFLRAVLISRSRQAAYRALRGVQARRIRRKRYIHGLRHLLAGGDAAAPIDFRHSGTGRDIAAMDFGHVGWIFHNVSPLALRPSPAHPRRVNLLLATINFDYLFGGYIGMFNLALRLRRDGHTVRIVLLDETDVQLNAWRSRIARYPGLGDLFDAVEVAYRHDRSLPLDVSPEDRFVATSGWSAHVAHKAEAALGRDKFLFLIQEFEPFFGPMNTNTALLRQAYDFPQFGLFSTGILRDYFRQNRIGLFEAEGGEDRSAVFSNAIQRFAPTRAQLGRRSRRILFYARPEDHAARNMFEMGIAALVALFSDPAIVAAGWTAHGIGSIATADRLELVPGTFLRMVPKTSLQGYIDMLPGFDVGLSLMLTPHPSLVPLEMAAAGLPTVTNTFANKTAAALAAISPNLVGVPPTLDGIVAGLRAAIARVDDVEGRLAGAEAMTWPTDWDAAFPQDTMDRVNAFLRG
ncbi:glycosyltransferase [Lichenibacterium ramalinae]|uniref:Glycosyltransferase n=1 Tax=Lichenibacterium ramalinae TaxID=2316527 RepID=A0A4Q2RCH8_9HYPH|nr:glycosyltransferase [Lichenibacterium ramalinae]RYB03487.1 glycosyltransferase [Lichenibacterium ramalinae]